MCYFVLDIPIEMFIIITAGIVIIIAVIIITIVIKCTCNKNGTSQENYPHFDGGTIPPNYGYTSSKAHQRSSWACTFKGGQQMNTHIWETPLPEPHDGEYTLPASMKKQFGIEGQPEQNLPEGTSVTSHHLELPLGRNQSQVQYTMPVKLRIGQQEAGHRIALIESDYTMPVKTEEHTNPKITSATSDYTIPVLPQPVPDTPDSESEYTVPTSMNVSGQEKPIAANGRSSLQRIL